MRYTENLNLPIVEDEDSMSLVYTQGNETNQKLDEKFVGYDTIPETLTTLQESINSVNSEIVNVKNDTESIADKVEILTKAVSEIEVTEGGATKKGKLHIVKFLVEPSTMTNDGYLFQEFGVDSETETRISAGVYNVRSQINATEIFGINDVSKIDILSCTSLAKGYYNYAGETNPMPMNVRTLAALPSAIGGNSDIILELYGSSTSMDKQTWHDVTSGGWQPSGAVYPQKGKVTIILQAVVYE